MLKSKMLLTMALFVGMGLINGLKGQDSTKSKIALGIRFITNYDFEVGRGNNFRTIHLAPLFSVHINHHNFYLGPQYSYVLQDRVSGIIFNENSYGLKFGYRYYSNFIFKNTRLFGEFNYSIF
jgi:hypothetical protein